MGLWLIVISHKKVRVEWYMHVSKTRGGSLRVMLRLFKFHADLHKSSTTRDVKVSPKQVRALLRYDYQRSHLDNFHIPGL